MMEKWRGQINLDLQPVSRVRPRKGAVGEDLGRTAFTTGPTRKVLGPSHKKYDPDLPDSDDEIDTFSHKNKLPSCTSRLPRPEVEVPRKGQRIMTYGKSHHKFSKATENVDIDERKSVSPLKRPRARPALKRAEPSGDANIPPSNKLALGSERFRDISEDDGLGTSPLEELSPNGTKRRKTSKARKKKIAPGPFPMDTEDAVEPKKSSSKQSSRELAPFPVHVTSPTSSIQKQEAAPFPLDSQSSHRKAPHSKPRTEPFPMATPSPNDSDDDDLQLRENDGILTYGGPRPFPMSMSPSSSEPSSIPSQSTRHEERRAMTADRSSAGHNTFQGLFLEEDENVDPSTICPYCDEPWPSAPSPTLIALLERTKRKSYADPRHGNPLGLKAPLTAFIELCQRHRFEMTHLPLARLRGWPTHIDFAGLPKRISAFRQDLIRIVERPDGSQFWRELRQDAKEIGMMKVLSVAGQYATFQRTQPGYYGEQGSAIIHQSLYSLFPPDCIPTETISPLTPDQFLTRVLVPETALLLIQQDMGLSAKNLAMDILEDSREYGVAMFPEQTQDEKVTEIGEQLARNRAKTRRKVLEERGEADDDVRREVEMEEQLVRKAKAKEKRGSKVTAKRKESKDSDNNFQPARRKTKTHPKATVAKPARQTWDEHEGDVLEESEEPTPRPVKMTKNFHESSTPSWTAAPSPSTPRPLKLHSDNSVGAEITTRRDDEAVVSSKHKKIKRPMDSSDSEVGMKTDTKKPTAKERARVTRDVAKIVELSSEETGNHTTSLVSGKMSKCTKEGRVAEVERDIKTNGSDALGQTRRRKKAIAEAQVAPSDRKEHGWLLNDSSDG